MPSLKAIQVGLVKSWKGSPQLLPRFHRGAGAHLPDERALLHCRFSLKGKNHILEFCDSAAVATVATSKCPRSWNYAWRISMWLGREERSRADVENTFASCFIHFFFPKFEARILRTRQTSGCAEGLPGPLCARYTACVALALEYLHIKERKAFARQKMHNSVFLFFQCF